MIISGFLPSGRNLLLTEKGAYVKEILKYICQRYNYFYDNNIIVVV
jgi:hypothetical protein